MVKVSTFFDVANWFPPSYLLFGTEQSPGLRFHAAQFCGLATRATSYISFSAINVMQQMKGSILLQK
jgi:hypothetical protein